MRMMKTRSNVIVALILIVLVSSLVFGQGGPQSGPGQQTTKGAVIKGKAPINKEVLKVKLPRAEEATLKNGLQVILLPAHKVPTFNMQLVVTTLVNVDKPEVAVSVAPRASVCSAMSLLERVFVPSRTNAAVKFARPR